MESKASSKTNTRKTSSKKNSKSTFYDQEESRSGFLIYEDNLSER